MSAARRQDDAPTAQRENRERALVAREAARLISEGGIGDHRQASARAASRLGLSGKAAVPSEQELDEALREYQRLFQKDQPRLLRRLREAALEAMRFLEAFSPRLVGAVLEGTADAHTVVSLQVFSDDADAVGRFLYDRAIPARVGARRVRLGGSAWSACTVLSFDADGIPFELLVLPTSALRQPPVVDGDERPVRRGSASRLRQLLEEEG